MECLIAEFNRLATMLGVKPPNTDRTCEYYRWLRYMSRQELHDICEHLDATEDPRKGFPSLRTFLGYVIPETGKARPRWYRETLSKIAQESERGARAWNEERAGRGLPPIKSKAAYFEFCEKDLGLRPFGLEAV